MVHLRQTSRPGAHAHDAARHRQTGGWGRGTTRRHMHRHRPKPDARFRAGDGYGRPYLYLLYFCTSLTIRQLQKKKK